MTRLASTRLPFELPHTLGSIFYREARGSYAVELRERPGERPRTWYVKGPRTPATYKLAERKLAEKIAAAGRGERSTSGTLTVGAWLDEWHEMQLAQKSRTTTAYEQRIRLYLKPLLGRRKLAELEAIDVARAMKKLASEDRPALAGAAAPRVKVLSPGTVHAAFRVLDDALGDAWTMGKAPRNACRGVEVMRAETIVEPPTLDELELLFAELAEDPWLPVFALMRETGARLGEVLGLERRNVDVDARTVEYVRQRANRRGAQLGSLKSRAARRKVAVPPYVAELLRPLVDRPRLDSPLLFTTSTGRSLDARNVLRHFDAACERAGIRPSEHADLEKYRPHDLRHAFATTLLEAGVDETRVAAWLGHASTAMLARYGHVKPLVTGASRRRLEAVWLDDLGLAFGIRPARGAHAQTVG